jgi:hypothetical protein
MKKCITCLIEKPFDDFYKNKKTKDGKQHYCKKCDKEKHQKCNKKEYWDQYYQTNSLDLKEYQVKRRIENPLYQKEYFQNNKNKIYKRQKNRIQNNSLIKFELSIRRFVYDSFKRVHNGKYKKSKRTQEILGCTLKEFAQHLQSQFVEGMTLENHGEWEIDHKIPLSTAKTEGEIIELNHYTNLQPLWKSDNRKKSNKII